MSHQKALCFWKRVSVMNTFCCTIRHHQPALSTALCWLHLPSSPSAPDTGSSQLLHLLLLQRADGAVHTPQDVVHCGAELLADQQLQSLEPPHPHLHRTCLLCDVERLTTIHLHFRVRVQVKGLTRVIITDIHAHASKCWKAELLNFICASSLSFAAICSSN